MARRSMLVTVDISCQLKRLSENGSWVFRLGCRSDHIRLVPDIHRVLVSDLTADEAASDGVQNLMFQAWAMNRKTSYSPS